MTTRRYTLRLTLAELRGLLALAGEGAEGLFNDAEAAASYIGSPARVAAARRAFLALRCATTRAERAQPPVDTQPPVAG